MENQKSQIAQREEEVLKFWKENNIFQKTLDKKFSGFLSFLRKSKEYIFFEGPPTANGKPGIHHLEARAFKDAIPRYKTMCGYHVRRKGGWDTHGLPVELQVEKKLNLNSKKAIEDYGIADFNKECKESVWEYTDLWSKFTDRIGYWVDQKNPYVTYHNDYIESVWNVVKEADKKNLLYRDYKVVPWCPRCGTALSSHELAQGYEDVKDLSVYVKFKLTKASSDTLAQVLGRGEREPVPDHSQEYTDSASYTYILAWTTTPWTLPGNVALAVGEDIDYVKIRVNTKASSDTLAQVLGRGEREPVPDHSKKYADETFIIAKERLSAIDGEYEIVSEFKGKDLIGLEYEPLYSFLKDNIDGEEAKKLNKAYKVYGASFVTIEDGTGIVHTAVMYGQDDFELGNKIGLPKYHLVGLDGKFLKGTEFLENRFVKDEDVAIDIIKDLAHRGILYKKEKYEHPYPFCWRCKTPLIYYARDSWYIKTTSLKNKMIEENQKINWEPSYIKEGRFGEWLKDIKDWAISRERYWGSPLPVWTCDKCNKKEIIGSIEDLKSKTKKSGNRYFIMRHGEAENNVIEDFDYKNDDNAHLTENGKNQATKSIKKFNNKIDVIFSSPFSKAKETSNIVCEKIGFSCNDIIYDNRLKEMKIGNAFQGKSKQEFREYYNYKYLDHLSDRTSDGESFIDVIKRIGSFLTEIENKYSNKNIFIVAHGILGRALDFVVNNLSLENISSQSSPFIGLNNGEIKEFNFCILPRNENYELDLHKPYIDEVSLTCNCGGKLERTKEVMDVWLDSGCMPFAQDHYPFENKKFVEKHYPADFICEAIDQTRGWFYTLHAVGNIMGKGRAYNNVICLGHILDAKGKKMSKSIGNVVDPWEMMDRYGADTIRLWMYSVNQPGESKNFDEKTVSELHGKVFNLLYNVLTFYELYRDKNIENFNKLPKSNNILDKWIISKLSLLIKDCTEKLDNYKLLEPVRDIRDFIDNLSTWYLRRSRERIKNGDIEAKQTLYFILKTLAKVMAPFTPFASEYIWQKLKTDNDKESVHLESWPKPLSVNREIINEMQETREAVTLGLQARQKNNIPVRQPLSKIIISDKKLKEEYIEILKEELNIKNVEFSENKEQKVILDTEINEELKQEGNYRELVRAIQDLRKKNGFNPSDIVTLEILTSEDGKKLINEFKNELLKTVVVKDIFIKDNDGEEIKIDNIVFKVSLVKN